MYSEKEILSLLENEDINFLAAAITPLHALGIEAAMYHLMRQGIALKGYVMIVAHMGTGYAITEENFHIAENMDVKVILSSNESVHKRLSQKVKDKYNLYHYYGTCKKNTGSRSFYYITPFCPSYYLLPKVAQVKKDCRMQLIITDEGLASYSPDVLKKMELKWIKRIKDKVIGEEWFLRSLQRADMVSYFLLLKRENDKWVKNDECVEAFKAVLAMDKVADELSHYENAVIINTAPLYEAGMLLQEVDLSLLKDTIEVLRKKDYTVIIKPHPREKRLDRYKGLDCVLEQNHGASQESILANLKVMPKCILGFNSTTLVTAKIIFGIRAISLNAGIDEQYLSDKNFTKLFYEYWADFVEIPQTTEELRNIIGGL